MSDWDFFVQSLRVGIKVSVVILAVGLVLIFIALPWKSWRKK